MIAIGIDPGKTGGIAMLDLYGNVVLGRLESMTDHDVSDFFEEAAGFREVYATLEDPRGVLPGIRSPKAIAGPAESYGFLRGCLVCHRIPFESIRPQAWQRHYRLPKRADVGDTAKKRAHKAAAQRLFPKENVTNWSADALLLAELARRFRIDQAVTETTSKAQ